MSIGIWQLALILVIVFVIFGAGKLPRVMGDVGKGIRSLRDGLKSEEGEKDAKKIDNASSSNEQ
ncbi:MAG: twin-arginine translocase TatA/TatE family subunit [Ketobacter sp.]|nr:twin-arginine translocase TatA/TatE family subunit [Ketobacter sp.]